MGDDLAKAVAALRFLPLAAAFRNSTHSLIVKEWKINLPTTFLDPYGRSLLVDAFHVSMALALTDIWL